MKVEKDYLIGAPVILETDCLPVLGMVINCNTPDIAMLRWIAYIKSLNPEFKHIAGKDNPVADMLSRARYEDEEELMEDDEDVGATVFCRAQQGEKEYPKPFTEELYDSEWLDIGYYLSTMSRQQGWSDAEFKQTRRKAYNFLLHDGFLWKRAKRFGDVPKRVICEEKTQVQLIREFHDNLWAGHKDLVTMPTGMWQMRYLILAREDLSNQVEGRALRTKSTEAVCRFLLEDVVCRYGCVGKITTDRGELDTHEARRFFEKCGVKLALTTAYNPEGNAKSERGHPPIVKAIVKACGWKAKEWPRLLQFALWADRCTHSSVTGRANARAETNNAHRGAYTHLGCFALEG
ncbi:hypothetical protein R1sor_014873 [Riccia sorocarpa]|uniref:Integrase catalytic domain-containing protein n=1 Tax=Riccia sorocarpa TaxID=122646 RepID=A0ABD3HGT5_9MARC